MSQTLDNQARLRLLSPRVLTLIAAEHLAGLTAEPISALSAPNHGLADIEHIVQQAPNYLRATGLLAIEHGHDQGAAVRRLFLENGFESVHTVQDYGGNDRVTVGQCP